MSDNVLIAVIAACGVVLSAICIFGGAIFAWLANNKHIDKRLERMENTLLSIQADLKEFYRMHIQLEAKVDKK